MKVKTVFWFGILGVIFFVFSIILAGYLLPNYSHISQLISESYATGTTYGVQLRYFGFLPSGIFIAIFAFSAIKVLRKSSLSKIGFLSIGIFYGLATVLVSIFPCDAGCESEIATQSIAQFIHNSIGFLTYTIVPVCVILLGFSAKKWKSGTYISYFGIFCGIISILFVGILSNDLHSDFAGLYQRIIEGSILIWILGLSFYLRKQ